MADYVGLGCITHCLVWEVEMEVELTNELYSLVYVVAHADD